MNKITPEEIITAARVAVSVALMNPSYIRARINEDGDVAELKRNTDIAEATNAGDVAGCGGGCGGMSI
jgi:hypothetical protein